MKKPAYSQLYRIPDFGYEIKAVLKELKLKSYHIGGILYQIDFPTDDAYVVFELMRRNMTVEECLKETT